VVGQQVLYRLRVLQHEDVSAVRWLVGLSFPSLRAEWLPGRAPDPAITNIGSGYLVFDEHRALFPAVPGRVEIPGARLGCISGTGTERVELEIEVPGTVLLVDPLPTAGRPADFTGVVGSVAVRTHVSHDRVPLGSAFTLGVTVAGEANVWAADPPLDPTRDLPGVDAYPRPPETTREPGRRLFSRRSFVWDVVPREMGGLRIPAARVPWYEPETGRYLVAEAAPFEIEVVEAGAAPLEPGSRRIEASPSSAGEEDGSPTEGRWLALVAVAAAAGLLATIYAVRRRSGARERDESGIDAAERALAAGDRDAALAALAAALRTGLERRAPGARTLTAGEIARGAKDGTAARAAALLERIDAARFAPGASVTPIDPDEVRTALRQLGDGG
jgi:hypothetical protein